MPVVARISAKQRCPCKRCRDSAGLALDFRPHLGHVSTVVEYQHPMPVRLRHTYKPPVQDGNHFSFEWADGRTTKMRTMSSTATITTDVFVPDPNIGPMQSPPHSRPVLN